MRGSDRNCILVDLKSISHVSICRVPLAPYQGRRKTPFFRAGRMSKATSSVDPVQLHNTGHAIFNADFSAFVQIIIPQTYKKSGGLDGVLVA